MNCFHLEERASHSRSLPPTHQGCAALHKTYFRDHATPYECLLLPHLPTPRPPIRRITRPPTQKRSTRFDWRATHARVFMQAALAAVPFGSILVRVRAHWEADCMRPCASFPPSSGSTAMPIFCAEWLSTQERWDPEVSIMFGAAARYRRA
jgi:hypothetical protein